MQRPRPARERLPLPSVAMSHRLPSWPALRPEDFDTSFDPDWWPSSLVTFSSRPSRWRLLRRPFGVAMGMIALVVIAALLYTLFNPVALDGDNASRLPVGIPPHVLAASPAAITVIEGDAAQLDRPSRRGGDNQHVELQVTPTPSPPDDPVLIWLPEILAASEETGVSPALIAGVIQVESRGNPQAESPHGARGLMQVMPEHLERRGVPEHQWHDPAANILMGSRLLEWNIETYGTEWDAIAHYFGIGCDGFNCTDAYVSDVLAWKAHYAPLIARP